MNKEIQGLESYSYDEIVDIVKDFITDRLHENYYSDDDVIIKNIKLHGSRLRGQARPDSDIDVVVEYEGDIREDDLFNLLHDEDPFYIDNVFIDVNPIKEDMRSYMKRSDLYDKRKLGLESTLRKTDNERILALEKRISKIEKKCNEKRKPINEVSQILAKVLPLIVKNLPLILNLLPKLVEILKTDQVNDNTENIDKIEKFTELGKEVIEMINNISKS